MTSKKLGPHFDPLNETEPSNSIYTLTIRCPPRPPPKWLPAFVTRTPVTHPNRGATHTIKPDNYGGKPNYDYFNVNDLLDMPTKVVKIKSWQFPAGMRCEHVEGSRKCEMGCYVLEKGGDFCRWKCGRDGCEGHVFDRNVLTNEGSIACFGEKGKRMVCSDRLPDVRKKS